MLNGTESKQFIPHKVALQVPYRVHPEISAENHIWAVHGEYSKHANLKYKFGNRHFWSEGYYVSTVGLNEATIRKYIQEQEKHDIALDKLSVKEYEDPFKGSR